MALNSGVFWPRHRFLKRPGTITVEFLEPIPAGLSRHAFKRRLEGELESATDRLVVAAGGPALPEPRAPRRAGDAREAGPSSPSSQEREDPSAPRTAG